MGRIIFSIVVLVVIAALIVLNAGAVAPFNLFGHTFAEVPVIVIAISGFVLGMLYSFVYYLMRAVAKIRRARMQGKTERLQVRVQEAESAAQQAEAAAQHAEAAAKQAATRSRRPGSSPAAVEAPPPEVPPKRSLFSRLFGGPEDGTGS